MIATAALVLVCSRGVRLAGTPAAPKDLVADPEKWVGRRVLLSTAGLQPEGADCLAYRRLASKPPDLTVRLLAPHRGVVPPKVDGIVQSAGPPVLVGDGRPVW